jgi:hypothetical protein
VICWYIVARFFFSGVVCEMIYCACGSPLVVACYTTQRALWFVL